MRVRRVDGATPRRSRLGTVPSGELPRKMSSGSHKQKSEILGPRVGPYSFFRVYVPLEGPLKGTLGSRIAGSRLGLRSRKCGQGRTFLRIALNPKP